MSIPRTKKWLASTVLVFVSISVAFGVSELIVRLLYKDETVLFPRFHVANRYGRYSIRSVRPNTTFSHTSADGTWKFVTNNRGFRNTRNFDYAKPPDVVRVISLGDSHTQGYEVRQEFTFSAVLERYLARHGKHAEVINAGVSGFSTAEELVFLESEGFKYSPDVVIIAFFANDFEDNLKAGLFRLDSERRLVQERFEHLPGVDTQTFLNRIPMVRWLSENSYFYSVLSNSVWRHMKRRLAASARQRAAAESAHPGAPNDDFEYAVATSARVSAHEIDLAAALIERIRDFCSNRGMRLIVVDIPSRKGPFFYSSSLPPALRARLSAARIEFIASEPLLAEYEGIAEIHVARGHHHISELTHNQIAIAIGQLMLEGQKPTAPSNSRQSSKVLPDPDI